MSDRTIRRKLTRRQKALIEAYQALTELEQVMARTWIHQHDISFLDGFENDRMINFVFMVVIQDDDTFYQLIKHWKS